MKFGDYQRMYGIDPTASVQQESNPTEESAVQPLRTEFPLVEIMESVEEMADRLGLALSSFPGLCRKIYNDLINESYDVMMAEIQKYLDDADDSIERAKRVIPSNFSSNNPNIDAVMSKIKLLSMGLDKRVDVVNNSIYDLINSDKWTTEVPPGCKTLYKDLMSKVSVFFILVLRIKSELADVIPKTKTIFGKQICPEAKAPSATDLNRTFDFITPEQFEFGMGSADLKKPKDEKANESAALKLHDEFPALESEEAMSQAYELLHEALNDFIDIGVGVVSRWMDESAEPINYAVAIKRVKDRAELVSSKWIPAIGGLTPQAKATAKYYCVQLDTDMTSANQTVLRIIEMGEWLNSDSLAYKNAYTVFYETVAKFYVSVIASLGKEHASIVPKTKNVCKELLCERALAASATDIQSFITRAEFEAAMKPIVPKKAS
ncbi:MAG: hypothetical protein LBQ76_08615 [Candidatus Fibromonas sp.]|jgi:hypothetical protein|nr:hypothetical protein [Candidatus Fibromonas sp.]